MSADKNIKKNLLLILVIIIGLVAIYYVFSSDSNSGQGEKIETELPAPENEELPEKEKAYIDDALNNLSLSGDIDGVDDLVMLDSVPAQVDALGAALERSKVNEAALRESLKNISNSTANAKARNRQQEEQDAILREQENLKRQLREKEAELQSAKVAARLNVFLNKDTVLRATNSEHDEYDNSVTTSVSAIPYNHGDIATTLGRSRERRGGFYGMSHVEVPRNSIKACVFGAQVVGDGQSLRIRLLEPMMVSGQLLPAGSILSGTCRITTDRLLVSIQSIECNGVITRVALEVYDNDGLQGLYVPGSLELEAGREVGSDIANSVGSAAASQTSMFSQQSASEQIKADVGRGVVQGTFRFIGKKLQVIKVTVQDKHLLFLMTQKQ
jgi:conjugative transposon TraM protein